MAELETTNQIDRRQQILDAALHVFSTKGFHKATNKDVAEAAGGISPGLIYWYFKDKQDLLVSPVRERANLLQLADHPDEFINLPFRVAIRQVASVYLSAFTDNAAFFRLLLTEAIRFPQIADLVYRGLASKMFNLINGYLQHQVELGVVRPHDTGTATRSLIGMLMIQVLAREVLHQPEAQAVSNEQLIDTVVEMFARGLEV